MIPARRLAHPLVGTALKNLLLKFFIQSQPGCGCDSLAEMMDSEGPEWCRQNRELIVDHMEREAERRGLPFARWVGTKLLDRAHKKAREAFQREAAGE